MFREMQGKILDLKETEQKVAVELRFSHKQIIYRL